MAKKEQLYTIVGNTYIDSATSLKKLAAVRMLLICVLSIGIGLTFTQIYELPVNDFQIAVFAAFSAFVLFIAYLNIKEFAIDITAILLTAFFTWRHFSDFEVLAGCIMKYLDSRLMNTYRYVSPTIRSIIESDASDELKARIFIPVLITIFALTFLVSIASRGKFSLVSICEILIILLIPAFAAEKATFVSGLVFAAAGMLGINSAWAGRVCESKLYYGKQAGLNLSADERFFRMNTRKKWFGERFEAYVKRYCCYMESSIHTFLIVVVSVIVATSIVPDGQLWNFQDMANKAGNEIEHFIVKTYYTYTANGTNSENPNGNNEPKPNDGVFFSDYGTGKGSTLSVNPPSMSDKPIINVSLKSDNDENIYFNGEIAVDYKNGVWSSIDSITSYSCAFLRDDIMAQYDNGYCDIFHDIVNTGVDSSGNPVYDNRVFTKEYAQEAIDSYLMYYDTYNDTLGNFLSREQWSSTLINNFAEAMDLILYQNTILVQYLTVNRSVFVPSGSETTSGAVSDDIIDTTMRGKNWEEQMEMKSFNTYYNSLRTLMEEDSSLVDYKLSDTTVGVPYVIIDQKIYIYNYSKDTYENADTGDVFYNGSSGTFKDGAYEVRKEALEIAAGATLYCNENGDFFFPVHNTLYTLDSDGEQYIPKDRIIVKDDTLSVDCRVSSALYELYAHKFYSDPGADVEDIASIKKEIEEYSEAYRNLNVNSNYVEIMQACDDIVQYFDDNYYYSLTANNLQPAGKKLSYFLNKSKGGHCALFATAMTLLVRDKGCAARFVTGFVLHPGQAVENDKSFYEHTFLENELHAWVEVYFDGYGWYQFDPTSSRSAPIGVQITLPTASYTTTPPTTTSSTSSTTSPSASSGSGNNGDSGEGSEETDFSQVIEIIVISLGSVIAAGAVLWAYLMSKKREKNMFYAFQNDKKDKSIREMWRLILKLLKRKNIEILPGETLEEFAQRADLQLKLLDVPPLCDIIDVIQMAEFGSGTDSDQRNAIYAFTVKLYVKVCGKNYTPKRVINRFR